MSFDSHAHLDDRAFAEDQAELIEELARQNIHCLIPGVDVSGISSALELVEDHDHLYLAIGIHPSEVSQADRVAELEAFLPHEKIRAIGEIGLDYYWVKDNKPQQQDLFVRQLRLAKRHKLPVIIHNRDAHEDVLNILKAEDMFAGGVILHAYSGSAELALEYVKLGAYISLAGPVTFKNARVPKEVAQVVPLNHLLVETDSPYLTPHPFRGKRNDPTKVQLVIEEIARLKGVSPQLVEAETTSNALRVFGL